MPIKNDIPFAAHAQNYDILTVLNSPTDSTSSRVEATEYIGIFTSPKKISQK